MMLLEKLAKAYWEKLVGENYPYQWEDITDQGRQHRIKEVRFALLLLAEAELPPAVISKGISHGVSRMSEFPDEATMSESRPHVTETIFRAMLRAIAEEKPNDAG